MRSLALVAVLLLAACGGGSGGNDPGPPGLDLGPPPSGVVYVQAVPPGTFPDSRLGEYDQVGADGFVRVRADILLGAMLARRTIAHEFGHALGLPHSADGCLMDPLAQNAQGFTACPHEGAAVPPVTLTVYVGLTPGLREAVLDVAGMWAAESAATLAVQ